LTSLATTAKPFAGVAGAGGFDGGVESVTISAAARPVGGALCQRHSPVPLLRVCFAATAVIALVLAFPATVGHAGHPSVVLPRRMPRPGLDPPLLLATVHRIGGAYGIGLTLLGGASAAHLYIHRRWIGDGRRLRHDHRFR
jgi:hypothetical protein